MLKQKNTNWYFHMNCKKAIPVAVHAKPLDYKKLSFVKFFPEYKMKPTDKLFPLKMQQQ